MARTADADHFAPVGILAANHVARIIARSLTRVPTEENPMTETKTRTIVPFLVFDVESAGLHGEGFAVGYVVVDPEDGAELEHGYARVPLVGIDASERDREWLKANVLPALDRLVAVEFDRPSQLREWFWAKWLEWKGRNAVLAADVAWPVEARFLAACISDDLTVRRWEGPYPLLDIASLRFAHGHDPVATVERRPNELPAHNPLADARQSARLLLNIVALNMTKENV